MRTRHLHSTNWFRTIIAHIFWFWIFPEMLNISLKQRWYFVTEEFHIIMYNRVVRTWGPSGFAKWYFLSFWKRLDFAPTWHSPLSVLIAITRNITKHFRKNCKHFTMSLFSGNMSGDIWPVIGFSKFHVYFQRVNLVGSCHMDIIWAQRVGRNRTLIGISTLNRGRKTGSELQRTNASTGDLRWTGK